MGAPSDSDVEQLRRYALANLPEKWAAWPGGWRGEAEAALIDAVFSIQAHYGTETTGVRAVVKRWRDARHADRLDDLRYLARYVDDPTPLEQILGNSQTVPGRSRTKASAVATAASRLVDAGADCAAKFDGYSDALRAAYCGVSGLGEVTWIYLLMLLGHSDVKADTMIRRFVASAVGERSAPECRRLVTRVAELLSVEATTLDHAIRDFERRT